MDVSSPDPKIYKSLQNINSLEILSPMQTFNIYILIKYFVDTIQFLASNSILRNSSLRKYVYCIMISSKSCYFYLKHFFLLKCHVFELL